MAHAQKQYFVFQRNGRVHLNRRRASVQSTTGSPGVRNSGSNAGYTVLRCSVNSTGYPIHSTVSPSLRLFLVTVCLHISTGLYHSITDTCRLHLQVEGARKFCRLLQVCFFFLPLRGKKFDSLYFGVVVKICLLLQGRRDNMV
jgi:hypothetical protein